MKERRKLFQKHEFCTKAKVHIMNFWDKGNVEYYGFLKKRRSFSTQEVGIKILP